MRISLCAVLPSAICGAVAAVALAAVPASAQTVEELTVTGHFGPSGEVRALSQVVSFADLDLYTRAGQDELGRRIDYTAGYLCRQLGESNDSDPIAPSCKAAAVKDAMTQAHFIIAEAHGRGPGWVPGPAWVPPGR